MNLSEALADANARRAHLIDQLSMTTPTDSAAGCTACRAKAAAGALLILATLLLVARRKARP